MNLGDLSSIVLKHKSILLGADLNGQIGQKRYGASVCHDSQGKTNTQKKRRRRKKKEKKKKAKRHLSLQQHMVLSWRTRTLIRKTKTLSPLLVKNKIAVGLLSSPSLRSQKHPRPQGNPDENCLTQRRTLLLKLHASHERQPHYNV